MDELIKSVIVNIPNFAVAILALYWQSKRMDALLDHQAQLVDKLLEMCDQNSALSTQLAHNNAPSASGEGK